MYSAQRFIYVVHLGILACVVDALPMASCCYVVEAFTRLLGESPIEIDSHSTAFREDVGSK